MSGDPSAAGDVVPRDVLAALGVPVPDEVAPTTGGATTAVWRVRVGTRLYALRVFDAGDDATREREVAAMRAARDAGAPTPRVCRNGTWRDRPVLLLEWCPGRTVAAELRARPWRAYPLGVLFGRTLGLIHGVVAPHALRSDGRSWRRWKVADPSLVAHLARLPRRRDRLLHLDYHPLNVLTDGQRITGVLDWTNAHAGEPRADLARSLAILRLDAEPTDASRFPVRALLRVFELGMRRGYRQVAGSLGELAPYFAWAGAAMERDLLPRLGPPGWPTPAKLARIRAWTARWRRRAGID